MVILGHVISQHEVNVDGEKVRALVERKAPKNVKQVQKFLGLCNYYRRFVKDFAKIAISLNQLLKKDQPFQWGDAQEHAFKTLIRILTSFPVLRQPDLSKTFIIHTDASSYALGAVLAQVSNGIEHACSYVSRALNKHEINYGITEKECLAVVFAVNKFRAYIFGCKFTVVTDHSALKWLMTISEPVGRLARSTMCLQSFDFEIIHGKGIKHSNADALSRPVSQALNLAIEREAESTSKVLDYYEDSHLQFYLKNHKHQEGAPKGQCTRVTKLAEKIILRESEDKDNLFFKHLDKELYIPRVEQRSDLVERMHLLGHFGAETTYNRLKERYYWMSMMNDVKDIVGKCDNCHVYKNKPTVEHPAKALEVLQLGDRVGIDLTFGLPETSDGYLGLLVITEYVSKYPWVTPIKSKSALEIADKLLLYISIFGPPKIILSDQGTEFNNSIVGNLLKHTGVEHKVTSGYHPRTNGMVERFNHVFVEALRCQIGANNQNWAVWIPYLALCYRSRIHSVTKFSPFELMFGRRMNFFDSYKTFEPITDEKLLIWNRATEIRTMIEGTLPQATSNIKNRQEIQIKAQNNAHRIDENELAKDTDVYLSLPGKKDKLFPRYTGPYTVLERAKNGNYILMDKMKNKLPDTFPRERLKVVEIKELEDESSNTFEVEKVVDHRTSKTGTYEYLVKWKNYSTAENTWEPEENFNSKQCISKYWAGKNKLVDEQPKRYTRSSKKAMITNMLSLLFFFTIMPGYSSLRVSINGTLPYCPTPQDALDLPFIDVESLCDKPAA